MKKTVSILLALCLLFALTACGGSGSSSATPAPQTSEETPASAGEETAESMDIRISVHPSAHGFPAYVAQELGYYEEQGLNVTDFLVYVTAPPQFEAYEAGAWDVGTTGFGGIVLGAAKSDIDIIGVSIDDAALMSFFVREDSPIAAAGQGNLDGYPNIYGTADTWKGAEVLLARGTTMELLLNATLEILGLSVDDITVTNMDKSTAFTAFSAGNGDMVQGDASFYFSSLDAGWIPVVSASDVDMYCPAVIVAKEGFAQEHPAAVQAYMAAYMQAVEWIRTHVDEAVPMMVDFLEENGVATTEENARQFIERQVALIPDVAGQLELFGPDASGEGTKLQNYIAELMNYYVNVGNYTQEDADALMLDENYDASFLEAIQ